MQGCEVQIWHRRIGRRHDVSLSRIEDGRVGLISDAPALLLRLFAHVVCKFDDLADVTPDVVGEVCESVREHICVSEAQDGVPGGLRERVLVVEVRIAEARVVIERIVDRMIDAARVAFAAIAEIERGDADVLQKRRVVRA